jgi:three-Cys-motif partner protein
LGVFAQGMKNRWNGNLHYLEICSGPGRLVDFESGQEFDGSALAVLQHQCANLLKSALFVDINPAVTTALNTRVAQLGNLGNLKPQAIEGDYTSNKSLQQVLNKRDKGGLTFAFLDPTDLSIPFDSVKYLSSNIGSLDLLINVPIGLDFRRNAAQAVMDEGYQNARDKYERFLGIPYFMSSPAVLDRLNSAADWPKELSHLFLEAYKEKLRTLGFCYFGTRQIEHYYHLLFATRDKKGIEFWNKCQKIEYTGQRTLF